ncbi:MAG: hypothetical protein KJ738_07845 [Actinobacteria bacterium]|nr:hypothetical protein [Propionicimonas sp.]MBU3976759.1 hypothetical protein [Actinomycetota bacterium]MBU3986854.1 hypothetical protein [Actinomycetota bacterium]MBU4065466.1 hypothetical protein [Actinomycetota bacterium]MBU4105957.1 hypothetical protein [Actinomycetota bacterium]
MFESSGVGAAQRLRAAIAARTQAEIDEAVAIADLAAENAWPEDAQFDVVGTRPIRIGADGTALVDEFLPLEVAALKGISVAAATWLIRDVVNLKARHPHLWFQVTKGHLPVFRACQLAVEVARYDLSLEESLALDAELAPKIATLPWARVLKLARGLITIIATDKVTALAEQARAQRYVRKHPTDDPTVAYVEARVDAADAIFFDAAVDRIADILGSQGDLDPKEIRRAKAVGILATPARAQLLLAEAVGDPSTGSGHWATAGSGNRAISLSLSKGKVRSTDRRLLPKATVYVHVAEETLLTGRGTARVEGVGAIPAAMLKLLLGNTRVRLTPVVQPFKKLAVDSYEIPARIRNQVILRDRVEVFPFSARPARNKDLDHTKPFQRGKPKQTRANNLGPLARKAHRAKTHGDWQLHQPAPGIFHWQSPAGYQYRIGPNGTTHHHHNSNHAAFDQALWQHDLDNPPPPTGTHVAQP